ncbi:MAG: response regulator [Acidobacteria bacterium]|nr:response regulator [Acidobacteriota bacterium]
MTDNKTILVIDDDPDTCNFLREIFEEEGWQVRTASNANAALAAVQAEPFALIVSDINLNE